MQMSVSYFNMPVVDCYYDVTMKNQDQIMKKNDIQFLFLMYIQTFQFYP